MFLFTISIIIINNRVIGGLWWGCPARRGQTSGSRWENGVYRGGSISTGLASNTNRNGARRTREKNVSGLSAVGFRLGCEWCISRWAFWLAWLY